MSLICDQCQTEAGVRNKAELFVEQSGDWYSGRLEPDSLQKLIIVRVCWRCRLNLGYRYALDLIDDVFTLVVNEDSLAGLPIDCEIIDFMWECVVEGDLPSGNFLFRNDVQKFKSSQIVRDQRPFPMRNLQGQLAVTLSKTWFEKSGYKVRTSGYENTHPQWITPMKSGDPNVAVTRIC